MFQKKKTTTRIHSNRYSSRDVWVKSLYTNLGGFLMTDKNFVHGSVQRSEQELNPLGVTIFHTLQKSGIIHRVRMGP